MKKIILFLIFFIAISVNHFSPVFAREREGVDVPFNITASYKTGITDGQFLLYAYQVLLNRVPDDGGAIANMTVLDSGQSRQTVFTNLMNAAEFTGNSNLNNSSNFVNRVYTYILNRQPDAKGLQDNLNQLSLWQTQLGKSTAWYYLFNAFLETGEYKNKNCTTQAYSYGQKINPGEPSLEDLFADTARFQTREESERVNLNFSGTPVTQIWDQKLPIVKYGEKYLGFTRGYFSDSRSFDIYMLTSSDGIHFGEAKRIFGNRAGGQTLYDAQVSVDYSYCPARYVMTLECGGGLCLSESSTPWYTWSWSKPKTVIGTSMVGDRYMSASTGTSLTDKNGKRYVYWTVIDDGKVYFQWPGASRSPDEGDESAYTKGAEMTDSNWTTNQVGGTILMPAEKNVYCTSSWDCNNKDKQDTKMEGGKYYLMYNGANYYRCGRSASGTGLTNIWGLSIARSSTPLGNFDAERLPKLIAAERNDACGISYPVINEINGELYMYYAYYLTAGGNYTMRSKLIWNTTSSGTGILDFRQLLSAFINIFAYNQLVKGFGK